MRIVQKTKNNQKIGCVDKVSNKTVSPIQKRQIQLTLTHRQKIMLHKF